MLLPSVDSRAAMAKRLSLFENPEATKLRALDDHVVVEFKFTPPNDPILLDTDRESRCMRKWVDSWRIYEGNAREWVVDSKAIPNGLIDPTSVRIREITRP
jgi:hypothetical protein